MNIKNGGAARRAPLTFTLNFTPPDAQLPPRRRPRPGWCADRSRSRCRKKRRSDAGTGLPSSAQETTTWTVAGNPTGAGHRRSASSSSPTAAPAASDRAGGRPPAVSQHLRHRAAPRRPGVRRRNVACWPTPTVRSPWWAAAQLRRTASPISSRGRQRHLRAGANWSAGAGMLGMEGTQAVFTSTEIPRGPCRPAGDIDGSAHYAHRPRHRTSPRTSRHRHRRDHT
jgi:hypothetical protein